MMSSTKARDAVVSESFVTLLRRYRMAAGLTQAALAKKLSVTPPTVSYWESGDSVPAPRLIPKLARILGIDAMELTKIIEPPSNGAISRGEGR